MAKTRQNIRNILKDKELNIELKSDREILNLVQNEA